MAAHPSIDTPPGAAPKRAFGLWICLALVVGNMIGSGVFLLPAALAPYGWNAIVGWIVTISGALCLAFVFASLARAFPRAGGPYAFMREAFGSAPAFAVAWSYWISVWTANATIAIAAVSYLSHFLPGLAAAPSYLAAGFVWAFTLVNCLSLRGAGGVQVVTTILKLLPLLAAIVLAFFIVGGDGGASLAPFEPARISLGAITATASLTLWAMVGFESATIPAGHVRNPERNIPRATMFGTAIAGAVYLVACSAVALLLPSEQAARSNAPFADFIGLHWGAGPASLVAMFATISALGALNGWVLIQGELPVALARDGLFPRWLAKTSAAGTPVRGAHPLVAARQPAPSRQPEPIDGRPVRVHGFGLHPRLARRLPRLFARRSRAPPKRAHRRRESASRRRSRRPPLLHLGNLRGGAGADRLGRRTLRQRAPHLPPDATQPSAPEGR